MKELYIILLIFIPLILVYVFSYFFNSKTDIPEDVEPLDKCSVCNSDTCTVRDMKESLDELKCELEEKDN